MTLVYRPREAYSTDICNMPLAVYAYISLEQVVASGTTQR